MQIKYIDFNSNLDVDVNIQKTIAAFQFVVVVFNKGG